MKLVVVYPEPLPDTKARAISVTQTASALASHCDTSILFASNGRAPKFPSPFLHSIPLKKSLFGLKSNKIFNYFLLRKLKKMDYDIVYTRHLKVADFLYRHQIDYIFECHEIFHCSNKKLKDLEHRVVENAKGLVFINKTLQSIFKETFRIDAIPQSVIHNATTFTLPYLKKDFKDRNQLVYIGNLYPWKGVDFLLEAVQKLPTVKLSIIGGGTRLRELRDKAKNLGIASRVDFKGHMPHSQIEKILKQTTLAVIPNTKSDYTNFSSPIKLYEYLSASSVVIASDMPTIREIVTDGVNGYLFQTGNLDDFVKTVKKALDAKSETLEKISYRAWQTSQQFTWDKRAEKIVEFAKSLEAGAF